MDFKKTLTLFVLVIIFLPMFSAINLEVEQISENEVWISDLDKPASFDLKIKNNGVTDSFKFYNLLGIKMTPIGTVQIFEGQSEKIELTANLKDVYDKKGYYTFEYRIRASDETEEIQKLRVKIIELEDAFQVGANAIDPESNTISVYLENTENFNFGNTKAKFSSPFFTIEEEFELNAYDIEEFEITLNKEEFKELKAGFYTLKVDLEVADKKTNIEGTIKFVEKNIVLTNEKEFGLFVNTNIIRKENDGNVLTKTETIVKKNIVSRLFTTFEPEPDFVDRQGSVVYYFWNKDIAPGGVLEIQVKTNWFFPLLIIFFVVAIVVLAKKYTDSDLVLRKRVNFVRTKGGEFALKVTVRATAKQYLERVSISDRLPPLVKVHQRFGGEHPTRINEKSRRLEWDFNSLEAGESRVLSYIIYSKVGILGKFALPSAVAIYQKDGKIKETTSNRAFFVAEQRKHDIQEE